MATQIEPDTQKRLLIASAKEGGFVVCGERYDINTDGRRFSVREEGLLFAGSLGDCLEFVAGYMRSEQQAA